MRIPHAGHSFLLLLIVFLAYFFVALIIGAVPQDPSNQLMVMFILQVGVILLPVLIFTRLKRYNPLRVFRLQGVVAWKLLIAVVMTVCTLVIMLELNVLLGPLFESYQDEVIEMKQRLTSAAHYNLYILFILVTIFPAICEETLFRGFILSGFQQTAGPIRAIILSGILFGLMHILLPQVVLMSLFGMVLGALLVLTGSLLVPIMMHFINNSLAILMMLCGEPTFLRSDPAEAGHISLFILIPALVVFICGLVVLIKTRPAPTGSLL